MPFISVKVISGAKQNSVTTTTSGLKVRLTAPAVAGRANQVLIKLLAQYFQSKSSAITIVTGHRSSRKLIHLDN